MKNQNQTKDASGKFQKVDRNPKPVIDDKAKFLQDVKAEVIAGYWYVDRVVKAYELITGLDTPVNNLVLRRTVLNYSE
jgi:hypothetical protein